MIWLYGFIANLINKLKQIFIYRILISTLPILRPNSLAMIPADPFGFPASNMNNPLKMQAPLHSDIQSSQLSR